MTLKGLHNYEVQQMNPLLARWLRLAALAGLAALVLFVAGGFLAGFRQFFQSYLFAYMFWLELTLGGLAVAMLHYLVGGEWGVMIRRVAETAAKNVGLMALLFIPVAIGVQYLYPWAQPAVVAADEILQQRQPYMNVPFFIVRAAVYFGVWLVLTRLTRWAYRPEYTTSLEMRSRLQRQSALGMIALGLSMSFAAVDWLMSLDAHWFSTIYPMLIVVGQILAGLAFAIALTPFLARRTPLGKIINSGHYRDLGALLLSFVLVWAYIGFSQYLIIWWANLPHDVSWYLVRSGGGWEYVGLAIYGIQFVLPFLVLLSVWAKSNPRVLILLSATILFMRLVDYYWHVAPAFSPGAITIHWMDLLAPVALGGIWTAVFAWNLRRTPLILPVIPHPEETREPEQRKPGRTSVEAE